MQYITYLIKCEVIVHKNKETLSKKWYKTKNDIDANIFLITSNKSFSSLVCKVDEIFIQTETNFNGQVIPKLIRKLFKRLKSIQYISNNNHLILTNYENSVILRVVIFRPLKYTKYKMLNLETILFSTLMSKFSGNWEKYS